MTDRAAFYQAIQGVRECNMDLTGWLEFFTGGLGRRPGGIASRAVTSCDIEL